MKRSNVFSIILGFVVILGIILLSASFFPQSVTFRPFGVNEVSQLLTFLVLISLFLERALEVFITTWRGPREQELDNEIQNNERVMAEKKELRDTKLEQPEAFMKTTELTQAPRKLKKEVAVEASTTESDKLTAEMNLELIKLKTNQQLRSAYKSQTRKIAMWTALLVGLIISGVGVHSLDTLVEPLALANPYSNIQLFMFRCLDTLLTGGLIAGGSDGIHKITQLFSTYFEETRNGIRDRAG